MKDFMRRLGLGDSYASLILGILVVAIVGALMVTLLRRGPSAPSLPTTKPAEIERIEQLQSEGKKQEGLPKKHTVEANENLWTISLRYYNSGYNWVDIAKANKLTNPDLLPVGTQLEIPKVEAKILPTTGTPAIQGDTYTVVRGDNLWTIAVGAYGDGFKWVEVAKVNNLANPDIIHAGNVLKIPR